MGKATFTFPLRVSHLPFPFNLHTAETYPEMIICNCWRSVWPLHRVKKTCFWRLSPHVWSNPDSNHGLYSLNWRAGTTKRINSLRRDRYLIIKINPDLFMKYWIAVSYLPNVLRSEGAKLPGYDARNMVLFTMPHFACTFCMITNIFMVLISWG